MKRWLEVLVFVGVAAALHLAVFASRSSSGITAGGSGGDALVSIKAAAPTVAEMVETWERPKATQSQLQPNLESPQAPVVDALTVPDLKVEQAPRPELTVALAKPPEQDNLDLDTAPPPPPEPKPEKEVKPDVKPQKQPKETPKQKGRKADVTSAGAAKQVSAGSGGGSQAGVGSAKVTTGSPGKKAKLQAVWGAKIRARIQRNTRHPRGNKEKGTVVLTLSISRNGRLLSSTLKTSSGNPELDQAVLQAVSRTKKFPKAPKDLQGESFRFAAPIQMFPRR